MAMHTSGSSLTSESELAGAGANIESKPTSDLRTELQGSGVELPGDAELTAASVRLNDALEELRRSDNKEVSTSFINLFNEIDHGEPEAEHSCGL